MAPLRVDEANPEEARELLRACCASTQWIERMLDRRPFGTHAALLGAAREEWFALEPDDWQEAFTAHPRIGDLASLRERFADTRHLAAREQSGVEGASEEVLTALAAGNAAYQQKFGYIFIVCATRLGAAQMLGMLQDRLKNDPATELRVAAEEQAKITALRLKGL